MDLGAEIHRGALRVSEPLVTGLRIRLLDLSLFP